MEAEVLPVEAQATQRNPAWRANVGGDGHAGVFERARGIHALMFGSEIRVRRASGRQRGSS